MFGCYADLNAEQKFRAQGQGLLQTFGQKSSWSHDHLTACQVFDLQVFFLYLVSLDLCESNDLASQLVLKFRGDYK